MRNPQIVSCPKYWGRIETCKECKHYPKDCTGEDKNE